MSATTTWAERFRAGQMPLSECDSLVLAVLARHHLMTTTQLHRLLGAGRTLRQIQRTMAKLAAAGLVMRAPYIQCQVKGRRGALRESGGRQP